MLRELIAQGAGNSDRLVSRHATSAPEPASMSVMPKPNCRTSASSCELAVWSFGAGFADLYVCICVQVQVGE